LVAGLYWHCNVIGNDTKNSPHVSSICLQTTTIFLSILPINSTYQVNIAIENTSLVPFVSSLTTGCYIWNAMWVADNITDTENLKINGFKSGSQLCTVADLIPVIEVLSLCGECWS
jgi:hypothetical protein